MGKFARKLGYVLAIGATIALFIYGFYILVPKITPYLTRPVSLILMIGLGGDITYYPRFDSREVQRRQIGMKTIRGYA
ncbi:MAG: hypothetical protein ACOC6I_00425 [Candidatus Bipolaricaulota bacterium]